MNEQSMQVPDPPDAPVWLDHAEACQWEFGWISGYQAGAASSVSADVRVPWDFEPQFGRTEGPEPSLASIVHRYYKPHFDDAVAARLTLEYMAALDAALAPAEARGKT